MYVSDWATNASNALWRLFHPARADRVDTALRIANGKDLERKPLAVLLRAVSNAASQRNDAGCSSPAYWLWAHASGKTQLSPLMVVDAVQALKQDESGRLESLLRNSGGTRPGSTHAGQINATREVIAAARQFSRHVRVAASSAQGGTP